MAEKDNKRFWQNTAGLYGYVVRRSSARLYEEICERIGERLTKDMSVLELACGTGQLSFPLGGSVALWEATDLSEAMIAKASKLPHSDRLHFSVQNAESLPYEHSTFDAVVISNALHIMPKPDKALREIRRVLKSDGLLFAPTYVHGTRRPSLRMRLMSLGGFRVYHRWTAGELQAYVERFGFSVETAILLNDSIAPLCYLEARNQK